MQLAGKHLLITGGAKRLGKAMAQHLCRPGSRLTIHYHQSKAEALAMTQWAKAQGAEAQAVSADLQAVAEVERLADAAIKSFGPVEILINSASIFFPTKHGEVTEKQWNDLQDVNTRAQFFLSQRCAQHLLAKKMPGVFLNLVDVNAQKVMPNYTPYVCSKAALLMMTRNLAKEWAPLIRVNSISPGPVLLPENYTPEQRQRSVERTLLKRLGTPEDIAAAAAFLIENDYITGADLAVDGGRSLS